MIVARRSRQCCWIAACAYGSALRRRTARSDCATSGHATIAAPVDASDIRHARAGSAARRSRSDFPAARVCLRHLHTFLQSFLRRLLLSYHRLEIALVLHTVVKVGANLWRGDARSRKGRFLCKCSSEQCTYRPRTSPLRDARTKPTMPRKLFFAPARKEEIEKNRVDFFAL